MDQNFANLLIKFAKMDQNLLKLYLIMFHAMWVQVCYDPCVCQINFVSILIQMSLVSNL